MPYWGAGADDCDFAFDSVGSVIYHIVNKLNKDIEVVLTNAYPDHSIIGHLTCLRLIGERFPKNLSVSFGRSRYEKVKAAFEQWYALSE